ncbi:hypothetical protein WJX82_001794 [Trebouxia sp. C0006]
MLTLFICVTLAATAFPPRFTAWALPAESPDTLDARASTLNDLPEVSVLGKPDASFDMHAGTVSSNSPQLPIGLQGPRTAQTFAEMVEQAWQTQAASIKVPSQLLVAFQMTQLCMGQDSSQNSAGTSCLDRTQLKVTHVDNFWKAVERTVAIGHLSPAASELPDNLNSGHGSANMQLSNTVIILPRIVTRLHPVHEAPHDHAYQDLMAWDVDFVIQMLQEFLQVSSAQTVPSVEEYRILPDKVILQNMYESYYRAEPAQRTPPIPTTQVKSQQSAERERELCYLAATTASEKDAVKQRLLKAVLELEQLVAPEHPVRSMVEGGSSAWMGQYIIKREFSEGSRHVFGITLPDLDSARPAADADPGQHRSGDLAGINLTPELDSMLDETADRLLQTSCGEGWLVQPRIANMSGLEYRVYMLGGAAAAMGAPDHDAVVYTPCHTDEAGLHTYDFTLPVGMICTDVLPRLGDTPDEVVITAYRPYELWSSPGVFQMILRAAHDGAQAMLSSPEGHLLRVVSNVMVRVDVVLGAS